MCCNIAISAVVCAPSPLPHLALFSWISLHWTISCICFLVVLVAWYEIEGVRALQAVLTLTMTAVRWCNSPGDSALLPPFLCHGLVCAVTNIPCHNKEVYAAALSCADALIGAQRSSSVAILNCPSTDLLSRRKAARVDEVAKLKDITCSNGYLYYTCMLLFLPGSATS